MISYNNDQRREAINTRHVFAAYQVAQQRVRQFRGSMVWSATKGTDYLLKSWYPDDRGARRQTSLGPRSPHTEQLKHDFDTARSDAKQRLSVVQEKLVRQSAVNRVLGLGRVPVLAARIMQAIDNVGLLGQSLRVIGTHSIYAYEAAAGVFVDSDVASTQDIDLLFDSRMRLRFIADDDNISPNLLEILKRVDKSFDAVPDAFRAANDEGYIVDLLKPLRAPFWKVDQIQLMAGEKDLAAVEIEGLIWLENAPIFQTVVIDERGRPLRMVTVDPRVFAVHKLWLSRQATRAPVQRHRDEAQARIVARMTIEHFAHLPFDPSELRMLPKNVVNEAVPLFKA